MSLTFIVSCNIFNFREKFVYICLCNNLNSEKVNHAIEKGVSSTKKIYAFYNCKPKCGKCIDFMNCMIERDRKSKVYLDSTY